jgi:cytoskeletal protein RodZ
MPALIYLIYSLTHVIIDMYKEQYSKAMINFWISAIFTLLLNVLCQQGLGIISWIIVSIPFILMTTIASLLLFSFKLNPATGEPLQQTTQPTQSVQTTQTTQPTQPTQTTSTQTQPTQTQPTQTQPTQTQQIQPIPETKQTHPSGYAYPIVARYNPSKYPHSFL